jgi:hypothetical protein
MLKTMSQTMSSRLWVSGLYKYGDGISMRAMTLEEHYVTPGFLEGPAANSAGSRF